MEGNRSLTPPLTVMNSLHRRLFNKVIMGPADDNSTSDASYTILVPFNRVITRRR